MLKEQIDDYFKGIAFLLACNLFILGHMKYLGVI